MQRGVKIALGTVAAILIVVLGLVALGVGWLAKNQEALADAGRESFKDGTRFGIHKDGTLCVTEALVRSDALGSGIHVVGEAKVKNFLDGCLRTARRETVCAQLSRGTDPIATAEALTAGCASLGHVGDARCLRLLGAVQRVCVRKGVSDEPPVNPAHPASP